MVDVTNLENRTLAGIVSWGLSGVSICFNSDKCFHIKYTHFYLFSVEANIRTCLREFIHTLTGSKNKLKSKALLKSATTWIRFKALRNLYHLSESTNMFEYNSKVKRNFAVNFISSEKGTIYFSNVSVLFNFYNFFKFTNHKLIQFVSVS